MTIADLRTGSLALAVDNAARAIPPVWPLASSVAVNPFLGLVDQKAVAELGVILMGVEQGVRPVRLGQLGSGDRVRQPPVVGLAGELEHPARHRDGDPVGGELFHERVEPFPGRFACER